MARIFEEAICKECKEKFWTNKNETICERCLMKLEDELEEKLHGERYAEEAYQDYLTTAFKKGELDL